MSCPEGQGFNKEGYGILRTNDGDYDSWTLEACEYQLDPDRHGKFFRGGSEAG